MIWWRRRLDHAIAIPVGVFRAARDDHPELCRHHVQTLRHVLADQNLLQSLTACGNLRFDDNLNPLQMSREAFPGTRRTFRLVLSGAFELGFDCRQAGLDFVEHEGVLLVVQCRAAQALRASAVARPLQHPHDRRQRRNPLVGRLVHHFEMAGACLQQRPLLGHGDDHRLQRINVVGKHCNGHRHRRHHSIFAASFPSFSKA